MFPITTFLQSRPKIFECIWVGLYATRSCPTYLSSMACGFRCSGFNPEPSSISGSCRNRYSINVRLLMVNPVASCQTIHPCLDLELGQGGLFYCGLSHMFLISQYSLVQRKGMVCSARRDSFAPTSSNQGSTEGIAFVYKASMATCLQVDISLCR